MQQAAKQLIGIKKPLASNLSTASLHESILSQAKLPLTARIRQNNALNSSADLASQAASQKPQSNNYDLAVKMVRNYDVDKLGIVSKASFMKVCKLLGIDIDNQVSFQFLTFTDNNKPRSRGNGGKRGRSEIRSTVKRSDEEIKLILNYYT